MSLYQYYEFRAVDRPLSRTEQDELRKISTRARITATGFVNHYEWGDFGGDPDRLRAISTCSCILQTLAHAGFRSACPGDCSMRPA